MGQGLRQAAETTAVVSDNMQVLQVVVDREDSACDLPADLLRFWRHHPVCDGVPCLAEIDEWVLLYDKRTLYLCFLSTS